MPACKGVEQNAKVYRRHWTRPRNDASSYHRGVPTRRLLGGGLLGRLPRDLESLERSDEAIHRVLSWALISARSDGKVLVQHVSGLARSVRLLLYRYVCK